MNIYTRDIARLLATTIETAKAVQNVLEQDDFDFSEASEAELQRAAWSVYQNLYA